MYSSINFDKCIYPCNHHHMQNRGYFHHPKRLPCTTPLSTNYCNYNLDLPFLVFQKNGITQNTLSLSIFLKYNHVACIISSFIFIVEYFTVDMPHNLFIHLLIDISVGLFSVWGVMNKAATKFQV